MKKPERQGKHRMPGLSEEDLLLWQHATRSMRPFHGRGKRVAATAFDEPGFKPHGTAPQIGRNRSASSPYNPQKSAAAPSGDQAPAAPSLAQFDTRTARKIRTGRIDIEARLDLHGMRQAEAFGALRTFLLRSQTRGHKWVLVITGKGTFVRDGESADWPADDRRGAQRGILRRNVPNWLDQPDLRSVVVSYTTAAIRHGGEGALYVQLRGGKK
jgi:DNA-nicking Smr family endonuclease